MNAIGLDDRQVAEFRNDIDRGTHFVEPKAPAGDDFLVAAAGRPKQIIGVSSSKVTIEMPRNPFRRSISFPDGNPAAIFHQHAFLADAMDSLSAEIAYSR